MIGPEVLLGGYEKAGLDVRSEAVRVALASLAFQGRTYRITRELNQSQIDCSTVVSQAHWLGAAVAVPFIAESQRLAASGWDVDPEDLLPGDAVYAYRSRAASPDGRHNHVGLFLGWDDYGRPIAIESKSPVGVRIVLLDDLDAEGGIRRFCPRPRAPVENGAWMAAAAAVPKLGRLGAVRTAGHAGMRRHEGVDVLVTPGSDVASPMLGDAVFLGRWGTMTVLVASDDRSTVTVVRNVDAHRSNGERARVDKGEVLGTVPERCVGECNRHWGRSWIHLELWASTALPFPPQGGGPVVPGHRFRPLVTDGVRYAAYNPVYAIKVGHLAPPAQAAVAHL